MLKWKHQSIIFEIRKNNLSHFTFKEKEERKKPSFSTFC